MSGAHQSIMVIADCLGYAELMICLCELNDVFILVWCRHILREITPVASGLSKSRLFGGFGNLDSPWQVIGSRAGAILLLWSQMVLASHI